MNHEFFTKRKPIKYSKVKKDTTRAKLWPWYVRNQYRNGLRIFWFLAEWPHQDSNQFEKLAKRFLKNRNWDASIK